MSDLELFNFQVTRRAFLGGSAGLAFGLPSDFRKRRKRNRRPAG